MLPLLSVAPRINRSLANGGLKRRCIPFLQRIRRLYIVMAVHQKNGRRPARFGVLAVTMG